MYLLPHPVSHATFNRVYDVFHSSLSDIFDIYQAPLFIKRNIFCFLSVYKDIAKITFFYSFFSYKVII